MPAPLLRPRLLRELARHRGLVAPIRLRAPRQRRALAQHTHHVGGPDVATAVLPNIDPAQFAGEKAEGNRARKVGDDDEEPRSRQIVVTGLAGKEDADEVKKMMQEMIHVLGGEGRIENYKLEDKD